MKSVTRSALRGIAMALALALSSAGGTTLAQQTQAPAPQAPAQDFQPSEGQAGKDVIWLPTPQVLVDKMLDMAKVTKADVVYDLGSGDGRTVITAAKRGGLRRTDWKAATSRR